MYKRQERGSFIVNPEGKIVAYEVNAGNVGRNADELLRKVQACLLYTSAKVSQRSIGRRGIPAWHAR